MLTTVRNELNLVELLNKVANGSGRDSVVAKSVLYQLNSAPVKDNAVCRKLLNVGWDLVSKHFGG